MDAGIFLIDNDAWAFAGVARDVATASGLPISSRLRPGNYLLSDPGSSPVASFIPLESIRTAADKRLIEERFARAAVPRPHTVLIETTEAVAEHLRAHGGRRHILKYPTSCGANGHRVLESTEAVPAKWPRPYVVQEFVRMAVPKVHRVYVVAGSSIGDNVRRFPAGQEQDLVAHATGAGYHYDEPVDAAGIRVAEAAIRAVGLETSFGVVDLLRDQTGEWLALEVGTDGIFNHVDRDFGNDRLKVRLDAGIGAAFREWARTHC